MRLTTDKAVSEMGMYELAHNSCYVKDGKARYRDFEKDVDARELARMMFKKYLNEYAPENDDVFDDYILECLMYDVFSTEGLIAVFYRNLWAMADMREELKRYEDLEESGRIVKLPCVVGDTVWVIAKSREIEESKVRDVSWRGITYPEGQRFWLNIGALIYFEQDFGKTVFPTREAAEAKLKEMEGKHEQN